MVNSKPAYFELRDDESFIRIKLIKVIYPNAIQEWDRSWIKAKVSVKAGSFSGQFDTQFMTTDFKRFKQDLTFLYDKLEGTMAFDTLEGQVKIKIKGDGIGHFEACCSVRDNVGTGNKLEFELNFDQTAIPDLLRQLKTIIDTYPV